MNTHEFDQAATGMEVIAKLLGSYYADLTAAGVPDAVAAVLLAALQAMLLKKEIA